MDDKLADLFSNYYILIKPSKKMEMQVCQTFECSAEWFTQALSLLVRKPDPCKTCSKLKVCTSTQTENARKTNADTQTVIRKQKSKGTGTDKIINATKIAKATMTEGPKKKCSPTMTEQTPKVMSTKATMTPSKSTCKNSTKSTTVETSSVTVQTDVCLFRESWCPPKGENLPMTPTTDNNLWSAPSESPQNLNPSVDERECAVVDLQSELDKLPKNVAKLCLDCYLCCRLSKIKFTPPLRYIWGYLKLFQHFVNTVCGVADFARQLMLRWIWHVQNLIEDLEYRPAPYAIMFDQCVLNWADQIGSWSFMEARTNAKFEFSKRRRQQQGAEKNYTPAMHVNKEPSKDIKQLNPQPGSSGPDTKREYRDRDDRDKLKKSFSDPTCDLTSLIPVVRNMKRENLFENERDANNGDNKRWKTAR